MTKGQRAMAVAKIYPKEMGRGAKGGKLARNLGVSTERVRQARKTLQYAPDLADNVLAGTGSLDHAYKTGLERKTAASFFVHRLCYSGLARGLDLRGGNTMDFWYLWHSMNVWSRFGVCFIAGACLLTLILVLLS